MIRLKAEFDKSSLARIEQKIKRALTSESTREKIVNIVMNSISIRKWNAFLTSKQFMGDFGIAPSDAKNMWSDFTSIVSDINITADSGGVNIRGISQNNIRAIMDHVWSNKAGRQIRVNAWDVYEYGIVGEGGGNGRIFGHHVSPAVNSSQKRYSRSGLSIMKRGGSVNFNKGSAPGIGAVRVDVSNMMQIIPHQVGKIIKGTII